MKTLLLWTLCVCMTSCTMSLTNVSTKGTASDVVDETATNSPSTKVTPTLSVPAAAL